MSLVMLLTGLPHVRTDVWDVTHVVERILIFRTKTKCLQSMSVFFANEIVCSHVRAQNHFCTGASFVAARLLCREPAARR